MKNKVKKFLKDIIIVWTVICTLLPTLFTGFAFAEDEEGYLNTERAGNYAANFAINFYENWSSVNETKNSGSNPNSGVVDNTYMWPLEGYTVSSEFGQQRFNYSHKGLDMSAFEGTPIYAVNGGVVEYIFNDCPNNYGKESTEIGGLYVEDCPDNDKCWNYGNHILIRHTQSDGTIVKTRYAHCTEIADGIAVGDTVEKGQLIGTVGTTGQSTGPHLHFEFIVNDEYKDPNDYIKGDASYSGASTESTYGIVKTEYDDTSNVFDIVEESSTSYKFNNKSWINFVYYKSLFQDDVNQVFEGAGQNLNIKSDYFDDKYNIPGVAEVAKDSPILDISTLISEGKILPGDILYVNKGNDPETNINNGYEYLFYVGGTKVIYATPDVDAGPSGALKYEYLEYYLRRIRRKLREGHELDENFEMPKYGVTEVYRIKSSVAVGIKEKDANLFFNGKGYYSKVTYEGIPTDVQLFESDFTIFKWLFDALKKLLEFLANLIIYMIRMQVIGWANLFENLLQHVLLGITGDNNSSGWDGIFGTSATSASGERVTVESIFFNKIPILDANFFNFESAGGRPLTTTIESSGPLQMGEDRTTATIPDIDNVAYRLRKNLRLIYMVIRNLSIAILLFILIAVGIRIAITSIAEKKAEYKKFLTSWLYAMCVVILMHLFMYTIFVVNDTFVGICEKWNHNAAKESVKEIIVSTNSDEEISLYDAVRTKAYAFNWKEGVPATIIYIFLIYLLIRFSYIYFKRYLTIYILALASSFMGVKYAIDRLMGKKTNSLGKWFKDFAFNVLLQTVHALIYTIFMAVAISVSENSVGGALVAGVILNFMLKADQIVIKIFGLDKAGSLAGVNQPEKYSDLFRKFLPIYTIATGTFKLAKRTVFGDQGFIRKRLDFLFAHNAETLKDANRIWEMRKYKLIGNVATAVSAVAVVAGGIPATLIGQRKNYAKLMKWVDKKLPIRHMRMLAHDLSYDTKKQYYNNIKGYVNQHTKRFTRKVGLVKDFALGTAGTIASIGMIIESPTAGIGMLIASRKRISKYKSMNRIESKVARYTATKKKTKEMKKKASFDYKVALNTYTSHEMKFQEEYNSLLDDYVKTAPGSSDRQDVENKIRQLRKNRRKERAEELHILQEADEKRTQTKIEYGNAKHEKNSNSHIGKAGQKIKRTLEGVTGLSSIENIAVSESRASYETRETAKKKGKMLDDMEKAAKLEEQLRKLTVDFKNEIKNIEVDGKKISADEANKIFEDYMSNTVKEASGLSVKANFVSKAVNEVLYNERKEKIEEKDIDNVIDKVQEGLRRAGKKTKISDEAKQMIKDELENKMISEGKGLGLEDKVASEIIRKVLGQEGAIKKKKQPAKPGTVYSNNDSIINKQQALLNKLVQIHTYNEVGKIKHKSSLIDITKAIKDAKKKRK